MAKTDIRKNDEVQMIGGKDVGKRGRVIHVLPERNRVMVEGVARATKHARTAGKRTRGASQLQQGGIIQAEAFVDLSNVQLVCRHCGKPTRVGHQVTDGVKARICKRCGGEN